MWAPELPRIRHRARAYPVLGALLALGSPLGYLALRTATLGAPAAPGWFAAELAAHAGAYAYMGLSTLVMFLALGRWLGRREDRLEESSATDPLTGLWNRRHLALRMHEELKRAERHDAPLALLMLDVDGLKPINDRLGHQAGDAALRVVADVLRDTCRTSDIAARVGGDEFAIVAPATTAAQAAELADRIRATVRGRSGLPGRVPAVTLSIGVAGVGQAGSADVEVLREAADRALYRAKAEGRDRTAIAETIAARSQRAVPIGSSALH